MRANETKIVVANTEDGRFSEEKKGFLVVDYFGVDRGGAGESGSFTGRFGEKKKSEDKKKKNTQKIFKFFLKKGIEKRGNKDGKKGSTGISKGERNETRDEKQEIRK